MTLLIVKIIFIKLNVITTLLLRFDARTQYEDPHKEEKRITKAEAVLLKTLH